MKPSNLLRRRVNLAAAVALICGAAGLASAVTPADLITPKTFTPPGQTGWRPEGCRQVPLEHPAIPARTTYRRAHADLESSDEVSLALTPVFHRDWVAETGLYHATSPTFDDDGNLYLAPLYPHEAVAMISLDPATGARRFALPNPLRRLKAPTLNGVAVHAAKACERFTY